MFYECQSLQFFKFRNFNTKNVVNMDTLFYRCKSLTSIEFSDFNTENVVNWFYV